MTPERKNRIDFVLQHRQNNLTVVLENVHDPHNISAVLRSCDAVGIKEVYILNTIIPKHKRLDNKTSSSALKWMQVHQFTNTTECFEVLRTKYKNIFATYLHDEAKDLYELDFTDSVALVFGNERNGVSLETMSLCNGNFLIPQVGMIKSLNISVACAVSIYEAYRQKKIAGHYDNATLSNSEQGELLKHWKSYGYPLD